MARVEIKSENKQKTDADFPKLKLENGQRARFVCLEDPEMEWVHTLRAPQIQNGYAQKQIVERRGEKVEEFKMDFIGRPVCLGDPGVLQDQGSDKKNCPICALAQEGDFARGPERRFAMHVVKYQTQPGGFEISQPFMVQTVVWSYGDKIFNKLADFASEWGDLRRHDLLMGPCTQATFQTAELAVSSKAEWLASPDRQQLAVQTFKLNQASDLSSFCGRKSTREWIEDDIHKIRERWAIAHGSALTVAGPSSAPTPDLAVGLDELLSSQANTPVLASAPLAESVSFDDLLATSAQPAAPVSAPTTSNPTGVTVAGVPLNEAISDGSIPMHSAPQPPADAVLAPEEKLKTAPTPAAPPQDDLLNLAAPPANATDTLSMDALLQL